MKLISIYILVCLMFWGCSNEKTLAPTPGPEDLYTLPQGAHDYDQKIQDYYDRYECYFLYVYTMEQALWSVDQKLTEIEITLPNTNYIGQILDLIHEEFLSYYPDSLLRKTLPLRLFLAGNTLEKYYWTEDGVLPGYNSLIIPGAREMEYTSDFTQNFKNTFHQTFIENYLTKKIPVPEEFEKVSTHYYGLPFSPTFGYGFFTNDGSKNAEADWKEFLVYAATNTEQHLKTRYFNPQFDPNGLIEKKYYLLTHYMLKNHKVDIIAIGNGAKQ